MIQAFEFYKTCRWQCPQCYTTQNGIIKKLKTQFFLKCCIKHCEHIISKQPEIADLVNMSVGDLK